MTIILRDIKKYVDVSDAIFTKLSLNDFGWEVFMKDVPNIFYSDGYLTTGCFDTDLNTKDDIFEVYIIKELLYTKIEKFDDYKYLQFNVKTNESKLLKQLKENDDCYYIKISKYMDLLSTMIFNELMKKESNHLELENHQKNVIKKKK